MPFGDSDDVDLGDLNSDDSLYMPSPQHSQQPPTAKGACLYNNDGSLHAASNPPWPTVRGLTHRIIQKLDK